MKLEEFLKQHPNFNVTTKYLADFNMFRIEIYDSSNCTAKTWSITEETLGIACIDLNTCLEVDLSRVHNDLVKTGGDLWQSD